MRFYIHKLQARSLNLWVEKGREGLRNRGREGGKEGGRKLSSKQISMRFGEESGKIRGVPEKSPRGGGLYRNTAEDYSIFRSL